MRRHMMSPAEPKHIQRLRIIPMMRFDLPRAAGEARFFLDLAPRTRIRETCPASMLFGMTRDGFQFPLIVRFERPLKPSWPCRLVTCPAAIYAVALRIGVRACQKQRPTMLAGKGLYFVCAHRRTIAGYGIMSRIFGQYRTSAIGVLGIYGIIGNLFSITLGLEPAFESLPLRQMLNKVKVKLQSVA
jgi:hypothetical protein